MGNLTKLNRLVFFYGTLKRGYGNHRRMFGDSTNNPNIKFIGNAKTMPEFGIVYANMLPYLIKDKLEVHGEVFRVSDSMLEQLDYLEGHPNHYVRTETKVMCKGKLCKVLLYVASESTIKASQLRERLAKGDAQLVDNFDTKMWKDKA